VRLDYWSSCGASSTNYVVTVNNGGATQTFRGTLTGGGDHGGRGSGRAITTFMRAGSSSVADALVGLDLPTHSVRLSAQTIEKLGVAALGR
jgi:hypothetical protein